MAPFEKSDGWSDVLVLFGRNFTRSSPGQRLVGDGGGYIYISIYVCMYVYIYPEVGGRRGNNLHQETPSFPHEELENCQWSVNHV